VEGANLSSAANSLRLIPAAIAIRGFWDFESTKPWEELPEF
jgi:hypothetical protein